MEEEYSISGGSGSTRYEVGRLHRKEVDDGEEIDYQETVEDMQAQNAALKEQIMTQIAIFEQYLKVAVL